MDDLLQDLTTQQFAALMTWLWVNKFPVSRAAVKGWRRRQGL